MLDGSSASALSVDSLDDSRLDWCLKGHIFLDCSAQGLDSRPGRPAAQRSAPRASAASSAMLGRALACPVAADPALAIPGVWEGRGISSSLEVDPSDDSDDSDDVESLSSLALGCAGSKFNAFILFICASVAGDCGGFFIALA